MYETGSYTEGFTASQFAAIIEVEFVFRITRAGAERESAAQFKFNPCTCITGNRKVIRNLIRVDDHKTVRPSHDDGGAVTVFTSQGEGVVEAFANNRAVLHQNHGILTASRHSVDDAVFWFMAMDRCCHVQLLIEASATKPALMEESAARHSATHVGSDYLGWLHFQPVYDQIVAANADMFE